MKNRDVYQRERVYKIGFVMMTIFFYVLLLVLFYNLFPGSNQGNSQAISHPYSDLNFMDDFTDKEENVLRNIVYGLDPKYSQFVKQINFTKDLNYIIDYCRSDSKAGGCNSRDRILLYYKGSYTEKWMREAVCHEVLHSLISSGKESHLIVYDLGRQGVCYK